MDYGGYATDMHEGVDGDGHQRTMETGMDKGETERRCLRRSVREQQAHGTCLTTTVTGQTSALSLLIYAHPTWPAV